SARSRASISTAAMSSAVTAASGGAMPLWTSARSKAVSARTIAARTAASPLADSPVVPVVTGLNNPMSAEFPPAAIGTRSLLGGDIKEHGLAFALHAHGEPVTVRTRLGNHGVASVGVEQTQQRVGRVRRALVREIHSGHRLSQHSPGEHGHRDVRGVHSTVPCRERAGFHGAESVLARLVRCAAPESAEAGAVRLVVDP